MCQICVHNFFVLAQGFIIIIILKKGLALRVLLTFLFILKINSILMDG